MRVVAQLRGLLCPKRQLLVAAKRLPVLWRVAPLLVAATPQGLISHFLAVAKPLGVQSRMAQLVVVATLGAAVHQAVALTPQAQAVNQSHLKFSFEELVQEAGQKLPVAVAGPGSVWSLVPGAAVPWQDEGH